MDLDQQTSENTRNISSLTTSVTELATMFKYSEKAREEERLDVKAAVNELKTLNDKITSMANVQKEVTALASDVRTMGHDFKSLQVNIQAIVQLRDKQVECEKKADKHETRLDNIETWKHKAEGAKDNTAVWIHGIWAICSIGGLSFITWVTGLWNSGGAHLSGE